jgi:acyl-CoA thioesterase FadM
MWMRYVSLRAMIPYIQYAKVVASSLSAPKLSLLDEYHLPLRVSLADVEVTRMNNGRFVTLMDLGRVGLCVRCGLLPAMLRKRWTPVVGGVSIRFRRSLRLGQEFDLVTRVAAFGEKFWYFDQRFEAGGELCAVAFVKAVMLGPRGSVSSSDILAAVDAPELVSPPLPDALRLWMQSEGSMHGDANYTRG